MSKDFDIDEDVRGRQVPTLIVYADADTAPPATTSRSPKLLHGGHGDGGWIAKAGQGRTRWRCCPASDPLQPRHQPLFAPVILDPPTSHNARPESTRLAHMPQQPVSDRSP